MKANMARGSLMWCSHCGEDKETMLYHHQRFICCLGCGKVLDCISFKGNSAFRKGKFYLDSHLEHWDSECLSDIDDSEIGQYLCNEEERHFKKIIWEEMNKDYLEEQALKEAMAVAVAQGTRQDNLTNGFDKLISPRELAAAVAEKSRKKKQNHGVDKRNSTLAKSLGGTSPVLKRKSFSSKINYAALERLYKNNAKKQRTKSEAAESCSGDLNAIDGNHAESNGEAVIANGESCGEMKPYGDGNKDDGDHYYSNEDENYCENEDDDYHDHWDDS
ncbi:hypothetical protein HPP92_016841 [Vanilla planifolia]|uniref:Brf1 TBP-binding domain-containing protein n=1 Tax=Vanilla planifolia TaxID=51239 RepID=A0A835USI7_VANPL|nr:hypothetical protein HPP92_016841 [Vanilla planifolia]